MTDTTFRFIQGGKKKNGSTVRFQGNFKDELQKTLYALERFLGSELPKLVELDSILSGNNNLKIRFSQKDGQSMILNCMFRYHHDDERYGYIHIESQITGFSMKPKSYFLGQFPVQDIQSMQEAIFTLFQKYK